MRLLALLPLLVAGVSLFPSISSTAPGTPPPTPPALCRSRGGKLLAAEAFALETCFLCYFYMPASQFVDGRKWTRANASNASNAYSVAPALTDGEQTVLANWSDASNPLYSSFVDSVSTRRWTDCCQAAEACCDDIAKHHHNHTADVGRCPPTWDGWQCWRDGGEADTTEYNACPAYIYFSTEKVHDTCAGVAEKRCSSDGRWHLDSRGVEYTDYTTCSVLSAMLAQEKVHLAMYAVSIVALLPALAIFFSYKVLRVARIAIHKNLFVSLLLHCVTMIIFKSLVLLPYIEKKPNEVSMLQENGFDCQLLLLLSKYLRLTNYTWMFCEGYYLHRLLANTFEEERSLLVFVVIGWGIPVVPCVAYAIARKLVSDELCWALPAETHSWVEWIYMVPGLVCIFANGAFFTNIFRILVTKLRAPHANEPAHFRKAVHATVVLLPLFGLHWLLTLYRPSQAEAPCAVIAMYKYINVLLDGLQGLIVAVTFCYRNGEIRHLVSGSWHRLRDRFLPGGSSGLHSSMHMKEIARKNSDTCYTHVGFTSTVAPKSRRGSSNSVGTNGSATHVGASASPQWNAPASPKPTPDFRGAKTTVEITENYAYRD